ncbi:hypothetical protein C7212DRAFT_355414 [Tuber magnatum]|uniref:Uncharacterized protein n=1 Tax=Tuber magnatum TaxID=42249 RepID=A0A317SWB9_9PEZI|nr:hypothetical protein C7212DRAFT_355414 [Tuber magnatum]
MSNQQPNTPFETNHSPQRYSLGTYIHGDGSGNSGSNNINSGNTTFNFNRENANSFGSSADVLQCLYTSEYGSHRGRVREPAEGTCTWVLEHPKYQEWSEKNVSSLLWLSADPGYGKSVIASFLVKHLKKRTDAIVCYFFFKEDNDEQRRATFALCAILHQHFVERSSLYGYGGGSDTLWDILIESVAKGGCGEVIRVVDALDECEEVTLGRFMHNVTRLPVSQTSDTPLKFLVTGRPYLKIERGLSSWATTIRLKGENEVNSISADVTLLIDKGINELESIRENPGGLGYLRSVLMSSADRTFLWVSLVLEILKDSEDDSPEGFADIVSTTPRDLAELYTKILNKSASYDKARQILHIVVGAARPLTLREMNIAFRMRRNQKSVKDQRDLPQGFEKTVKNLCGLFVRIIDSKIYLVHQTAREFLIKGTLAGQGNWQYTLSPIDSSFILADICISYLSLREFESDPLMVDGARIPNRWAVDSYLRKYPLLDYAASHWADHFLDSQDRQMELFECTKLICSGGSHRFHTWVSVYWQNSDLYCPPPHDFTHLMVASWLGQRTVVERLLAEGGGINTRSKSYGTALNIAALREDKDIARMLVESSGNAYICEREYNILDVSRLLL